MTDTAHERVPRWSRRRGTLIAAALAALLALALGGGLAAAIIADTDAEPCWSVYVDGPGGGGDSASDVAVTATDVWVCGQVYNGDTKKLDASLTRIPRGGDDHITYLWNSVSSSNDANYDLAVRGSYLYTAGASRNLSDNLDLLLIRYSTTTGAVKWFKRWNGPGKFDDVATDVAVDADGNVIVCGTTRPVTAGDTDWVVLKYGRDGTKKWTWYYDGPVDGDLDQPTEMLVDGAGNVYVTGKVVTSPSTSASYTVKLSPKGVRLWGRRYAGPEPGSTAAWAIARCPSGGVYVGGDTWTAATGFDMFVQRYSASGERTAFERFGEKILDTSAQTLNDLAVASNGEIIGVGSQDGLSAAWCRWRPDGSILGNGLDASGKVDEWDGVATDAVGGFYLTGYGRDLANHTVLTTNRWSVANNGARWESEIGADEYARGMRAIAVRGLTVAIAGYDKVDGVDNDLAAHIWVY